MSQTNERVITICSAACTTAASKYYCQLNPSISNARKVRVVDASVTMGAALNDLIIICSDNLTSTGDGDIVRLGTAANNSIATNILTTCRPPNSTTGTVAFDVGTSSIYSDLATNAYDYVNLFFLSATGSLVTPTSFCLVLEFVF